MFTVTVKFAVGCLEKLASTLEFGRSDHHRIGHLVASIWYYLVGMKFLKGRSAVKKRDSDFGIFFRAAQPMLVSGGTRARCSRSSDVDGRRGSPGVIGFPISRKNRPSLGVVVISCTTGSVDVFRNACFAPPGIWAKSPFFQELAHLAPLKDTTNGEGSCRTFISALPPI
jgi:hypothetical protein